MNIIHYIKEHPGKTAVGVFVVGILYLFLRRNGSGAGQTVVTAGPTATDVQFGTQLQIAQLQAQQAGNQTQAAANVESQKIGADVTIAGYEAAYQTNAATLQADTAKYIASLQSGVTLGVSTLQAQVSENQTNAQLEAFKDASANALAIASLPYSKNNNETVLANETKYLSYTTAPRAPGSPTYNQYGPGGDYINGFGQHFVNPPVLTPEVIASFAS